MMIGGAILTPVATYTENRRRFGWCKNVSNAPVAKRVMLFRHDNSEYIASTFSRASDGYWELKGLPYDLPDYTIMEVAIDDTMTYESVVRNHKSLVQ